MGLRLQVVLLCAILCSHLRIHGYTQWGHLTHKSHALCGVKPPMLVIEANVISMAVFIRAYNRGIALVRLTEMPVLLFPFAETILAEPW